jgi:hypothetical protein
MLRILKRRISDFGKLHQRPFRTERRDDFWVRTSKCETDRRCSSTSPSTPRDESVRRWTRRGTIIVSDNVLFEGGAGETMKRELLKQGDVHIDPIYLSSLGQLTRSFSCPIG